MDENSCENETSESADGQKAKETENAPRLEYAGIKLTLGPQQTGPKVTDGGSPLNDSGPSTVFTLEDDDDDDDDDKNTVLVGADIRRFAGETQCEVMESSERADNAREQTDSGISVAGSQQRYEETGECSEVPEPAEETVTEGISPIPPRYEERQQFQHRVRMAPSVTEQLGARRPSVGPPPSYSFVMKQKKKLKTVPSVDPLVITTPPPPSYTGSRSMFSSSEERICNFPSFADPIWRSHSQPALCPRCGILVLTTTHTHDSIATHVAALALCLFGCWPCCLIPYYMNVCKNTYHHCPICQTFLGLYKPW